MAKRKPKSKALWGGRFESAPSAAFQSINNSFTVDRILLRQDIAGSLAHARMLHKQGLLTKKETTSIIDGLLKIERDWMQGKNWPGSREHEDVHSFVEATLTSLIGDAGAKLHTGRSRNDQVATDTRLYLREQIHLVQRLLLGAMRSFTETAEKYHATAMPAYTHLQRAQPVTLGHHLLAYVEAMGRDFERLSDCAGRMNQSPLGAGACSGTGLPIDRAMTARELGFTGPMKNSMDAVAARDYLIEFLACGANLGVTLSRLAEDLILWSSSEFGFVRMSDAVTSGSSMMPQKKNPDAAELLRGKAGRLIGNLTTLLVAAKGLPLTYNKDLQEDKEALLDTCATLYHCLGVLPDMFKDLRVDTGRMAEAARAGYANATELADYLVRKGLPFRHAHEVVGKVVLHAEQNGVAFIEELNLDELRYFSELIDKDVYKHLSLEAALKARNHVGGTAPARVKREAAAWKKTIASLVKRLK